MLCCVSPRAGHVLRKMEPLLKFGFKANSHLCEIKTGQNQAGVALKIPWAAARVGSTPPLLVLAGNEVQTQNDWRLYLDEIRAGLHRARPVVTPLRYRYVPDQQVRGQVTGSQGVVRRLQERETRDAASAALLLADHQPVGVETPARIQVEVEHWVQREGGGGCEGGWE